MYRYVGKNVCQASLPSFLLAVFLFRSMSNANYLLSSVFLLLAGDNSLVHDIRKIAAVKLHLSATYTQCLVLKSVYKKSQYVIGDKLFSSNRTVLELAQSLWHSKTSDLNCLYEALAQREALTICQDRVFASFLCVLSLSSVLGS